METTVFLTLLGVSPTIPRRSIKDSPGCRGGNLAGYLGIMEKKMETTI